MSAPPPRRTKSAPRPIKRASSPRQGKPIVFELVGLALVMLGLLLLVAPFVHRPATEFMLKWCMQVPFGTYGAWGIGIAVLLLGFFVLINLAMMEFSITALGMGVLFLSAISMFQLNRAPVVWYPQGFETTPGGCLGGLIAGGLYYVLGNFSWIVLVSFALGGISLMTHIPLWQLLKLPFVWIIRGCKYVGRSGQQDVLAKWKSESADDKAARVAELKAEELRSRKQAVMDRDDAPVTPSFPPRPEVVSPSMLPRVKIDMPEESFAPEPEDEKSAARAKGKAYTPELALGLDDDNVVAVSAPANRPYALPPVDLLNVTPKPVRSGKDDTQEKVTILEQTLSSFGIDAKVVGVERGPRVTRFEMVPPPGIRINRITNLADNIALSLSALDVRVEAPVPGKGVVGIEVPNKEPVIVDLREIVESESFTKGKTPVAFALGRDIAGVPRCADLTRMPHLLIAGATNSGKSVCINTLICSILMRATPQQVKFLMVDPKRVELSLFQSIPHLIAPVAYDAKHAAGLLRWAIREMEQRYEMFAEKGVRNIIGFNEQSRLEGLEEVPYIVIIIDELADLMMQAAAEFESSICRIAQLARATGIHLVVATQRPSVNVITGTIKANIPSRIAFAVASQVDSRTILDMNGAERLVGQGDMLYLPVDASKPSRIQGAYVSEKEINRIVEHVKSQGKPQFSDDIMAIEEDALREDSGGGGLSDTPDDEMYERALDYIRTTKYASTSMLQRKFRIGYTRAARMMDNFEERGFVGPGQGSKPREVIFAPAASVVGARSAEATTDDAFEVGGGYADDEE